VTKIPRNGTVTPVISRARGDNGDSAMLCWNKGTYSVTTLYDDLAEDLLDIATVPFDLFGEA
jgi:hypothetical protein